MGAPNSDLIPAAILLDHPGLTEDAFADELNQTHACDGRSCHVEHDWGYYHGKDEEPRYHQGLFGLAYLLRLRCRQEYGTFFDRESEQFGFTKDEEYFRVVPRVENGMCIRPEYLVRKHVYDEMGPACTESFFDSPGEYRPHTLMHGRERELYLLDKVQERGMTDEEKAERAVDDGRHFVWVTAELRRITEHFEEVKYDDVATLAESHPHWDPRTIYDFAQADGTFAGRHSTDDQDLRWLRRDDRYYLDVQRLFDKKLEHVYTSIVITAEAIREKAWNLLCYDGRRHVDRFLADFPAARKRHEQAVKSWWLSRYCASNKLTHADMLRLLQDIRRDAIHLSSEHDARILAQKVGEEGFGSGRYLMDNQFDRDKKQFTEGEQQQIAAAIERGEGVTPFIRAYVQEKRMRLEQLEREGGLPKPPPDTIPF